MDWPDSSKMKTLGLRDLGILQMQWTSAPRVFWLLYHVHTYNVRRERGASATSTDN
jgi:hypothetical protein